MKPYVPPLAGLAITLALPAAAVAEPTCRSFEATILLHMVKEAVRARLAFARRAQW